MPLVVKSGTAIDEAMKLRGMRPQGHRQGAAGRRHQQDSARSAATSPRSWPARSRSRSSKVDPMTCVAQGAAIVSAILQGAPGLDNYAYSVKLEHSLCANPVDQRTNRVFLDPIIKRGADIPCSFTKTYYPVADPADRVLISVYEGDVYDNPESPENVKLAEIPVGVQAAAAAARRRPGGGLRVRRRRHSDRADPGRATPARRSASPSSRPARTRWTPRSSSR